MTELLGLIGKIFDFLRFSWKRQRYKYRFLIITDQTPAKQISVANSIEYEFINSGNSYVIINQSLKLYPAFMGIEPCRLKLRMNKNEVDTTVYEIAFAAIGDNDPVAGTNLWDDGTTRANVLTGWLPTLSKNPIYTLTVIIKEADES